LSRADRTAVHLQEVQICGAKNAVVEAGLTPSQPRIVPVTRLLD